MGLSVGSQIIKVILFIFNLLWLLFGIILVIVGAIIYTEKLKIFVEALKDYDATKFAVFLMVIGVLTIVISFCGCCGAMQESQCLTVTYSVLLFIIIIVQVTVAIVIFVKLKEDTVKDLIKEHMEKIFEDDQHREKVDEIQSTLKCCGTTGPDFWKSKTMPDSCCPDKKTSCDEIYSFKDGCNEQLIKFVNTHKNKMGFSSLGFALVEFIAFIFSCVLAKNMD